MNDSGVCGIEIVDGTLNIYNSDINFNFAAGGGGPGNGGGIHITGATQTDITASFFIGNYAALEGGALWNSAPGTMNIFGTTIAANEAAGDGPDNGGGGVFNNGGILSIDTSLIDANEATGTLGSGGGILAVDGGSVTIDDTTISNNLANRAGGGLEANDTAGSIAVDIDSTVFRENEALNDGVSAAGGNGGGIHLTGGTGSTIDIDDSIFDSNIATVEGSGFWNDSGWTATVNETTFFDNIAAGNAADEGGGGIFNNNGTLFLNDSTLRTNLATGTSGSGGGLLSIGGMLMVSGTLFDGNTANRAGGGVELAGGTNNTFSGNVFSNNSTGSNPGNGGGIHAGSGTELSLDGDTFINNSADNDGGGLWISGTSIATVDNATFTFNTAVDEGGAIYVVDGGDLTVDGSVLVNNEATEGQAIGSGGSSGTGNIVITDSIIDDDEVIGGSQDDELTGDSGDNILIGQGGNDMLFGLGGNDTLIGGDGNDQYVVNSGGDVVIEATGSGGFDSVLSLNTINLTNANFQGTIEAVSLFGSNSANAIGNSANNFLRGNDANNILNGLLGNDTLTGGMGTDAFVFSTTPMAGNAADEGGGGIFNNNGTLFLNDSTLRTNLATGTSGSGGGLLSIGGMLMVSGTLFDGNTANRAGGGGVFNNSGILSIDTSLIDANEATGTLGSGGGILAVDGGSVTIDDTTISNNLANRAGGGLEANDTAGSIAVDIDGDGFDERTAWMGPGDGTLVIDLDVNGNPGPDNIIDRIEEVSFSASLPNQDLTNLEALALLYDSNGDTVLDANDDRWRCCPPILPEVVIARHSVMH